MPAPADAGKPQTCRRGSLKPGPADAARRSILFVCLGNICRSPTAAGVFRYVAAREAPQLDLQVDSAGTGDYHIGDPPDPRSQRAALRRGIDLSAMRARQVTVRDFERFHFILAMDRDNLKTLEAIRPSGSTAVLRLFLDYADCVRESEVPDPYYGGSEAFERVLDLTMQASQGLIAALLRASPRTDCPRL